MTDMTPVIVPKSDQINADDLIAGPMTITIREVQIRGGQEQPVSIYFDGSEKAYRPCKSMSRVLVQGWGADASKYVGRSLTLYRDPHVKWAGLEVGGIRISHMSHIDSEKLMMLTATKGSRKPHRVLPLQVEPPRDKAAEWVAEQRKAIIAADDVAALDAVMVKVSRGLAKLEKDRPELHAELIAVEAARREALVDDDDPFDTTPDWQARASDLLAAIGKASAPDQLDAAQDEYREVCTAMPKALADQIEAALAEKRAGFDG